MTEAQSLRDYIAHKQAQIDHLIDKWGDGVRPAWVGEEIGILYHYQDDAIQTLKQLEASNEPDNSNH